MTDLQKLQIRQLRNEGKSYSKIAAELGVSENTIKSYCRRNKIGKVAETPVCCANCNAALEHTAGVKRKRFCSAQCRIAWWNAHPQNVNQKAVYNFTCPVCGTPFTAYGNKKRKYCSHKCYIAFRFKAGDEHE